MNQFFFASLVFLLIGCKGAADQEVQSEISDMIDVTRIGRIVAPEQGGLNLLDCENASTGIVETLPTELIKHVERLRVDTNYRLFLQANGKLDKNGWFHITQVISMYDEDPCKKDWSGSYGDLRESWPDNVTGKLLLDANGTFHLVTVLSDGSDRQEVTGTWMATGIGLELRSDNDTLFIELLGPNSIAVRDARPGMTLSLERIG